LMAFKADSLAATDSARYLAAFTKVGVGLVELPGLRQVTQNTYYSYEFTERNFVLMAGPAGKQIVNLKSGKSILVAPQAKVEIVQSPGAFYIAAGIENKLLLYDERGKVAIDQPSKKFLWLNRNRFIAVSDKGATVLDGIPAKEGSFKTYLSVAASGTLVERSGLPLIADSKKGLLLVSQTGAELAGPFEQLNYVGQNLYAAGSVGKLQLIRSTGKEVNAATYAQIGAFESGLSLVKSNDRFMYVNRAGTQSIPAFPFDTLLPFTKGRAAYGINGKYGLLSTSMKAISPALYAEQEIAKLLAE
jgi:hypothetical protein